MTSEIEQFRRDLVNHASSISLIATDLRNTKDELNLLRNGIESERKVRLVEDRHLNERLDRMEKGIDSLHSIGKWILAAFGAAFIAAVSSFVLNGGLNVPTP